jgi:hypothetical protein
VNDKATDMARRLAPAGAACYALWGLLHVGLGVAMVADALSDGLPRDELAAESLMFFVSAIVLGAVAIAVAVRLNRINDRFGYWLNLCMGGVVDIAFVVVLVSRGHIDLAGGLSDPVVFLVAAVLSTGAILSERTSEERRRELQRRDAG